MKKQDIRSLVIYAIILVALFLTAYFGVITHRVVKDVAKIAGNEFLPVAWSILAIIGTFFVSGILLEVGHILGAKIGKYEIISINFFGLTFYKLEGENKTKFKVSSPDGLFGETVVSPKYNDKGEVISKPKAMLWLGNLFLALCIIVSAILVTLFGSKTDVVISQISLLVAVSFGCVLFYNMLPLELDNKTDGDQLRIVSKPGNIAAYNELLRVMSCEITNKDPGEAKVFEEITNYTAAINNVTIYKNLSEENYSGALSLINKILDKSDNISNRAKIEFLTQKLYILLYTKALDKAKKLYEDELSLEEKRLISNNNDLIFIRTYLLISAILDPAESEVQYATSRAEKAYKKVEALKKPVEAMLYNNAVARVKELHPTWEVEIKEEKK